MSSIAVAHEVASMGVKAIACLNSRDRNRLGFVDQPQLTPGLPGLPWAAAPWAMTYYLN